MITIPSPTRTAARRFAALALLVPGSLTTAQSEPVPAASPESPVMTAAEEFFTPEMDAAVEAVLAKMTVDEKLKMVNGDVEGRGPKNRGSASVDRVGIGTMVFYNGPRGYQMSKTSTLFPAGVGLAASFRPDLVENVAGAIARELLSDGIEVLEAPSINIIRDPLNGRNFEYFTEDPYLNGQLAAAFVRGGQRAGAVTTAKHLVANNKETNRNQVNAVLGERAMREIYLPGFKAAVDAGVLSLMTGANRVNGPHASDNPDLIRIIKQEWNWPGFLYTDWNGAQTSAEAFNAGLDLSMPGQPTGTFRLEELRALLEAGTIQESDVDDKVRRLLRGVYFSGQLEGSPTRGPIPFDSEAHHTLAFEAAIAGMTLVKNDTQLLPLAEDVKSIALLGPMAENRFSDQTGGSSGVQGVPYEITVREGLEHKFGADRVKLVPFSADAAFETIGAEHVLHQDEAGATVPGYLGSYTGHDPNSGESVAFTRAEPEIAFNWEMASPDRNQLRAGDYSATWTGTLVPPVSGKYTLRLNGSQIVYLRLDGEVVLNKHYIQASSERTLELEAGRSYALEMSVRKLPFVVDSVFRLSWIRPDARERLDDVLQASVTAAADADVVVLCVGQDHNVESEGMDRHSMRLPEYQDRLIAAVVEANPRTVVVLYAGSPIAMDPWFDATSTLVLPWFPGIENGHALAALLSGDRDFGGRMPMTFPKRYEDSPAHPSRQVPDKHDTIEHIEGIFVGYRWFQQQQIDPLIPFGHGLSTTSWAYSNLAIEQQADAVEVQVQVKNTGDRAGTEVVQVYVHDPVASLPRPEQELKGFTSLSLPAGEQQTVTFRLGNEAFSYFDPARDQWVLEPGEFEIRIGRSVQDIQASGRITLPEEDETPQ